MMTMGNTTWNDSLSYIEDIAMVEKKQNKTQCRSLTLHKPHTKYMNEKGGQMAELTRLHWREGNQLLQDEKDFTLS